MNSETLTGTLPAVAPEIAWDALRDQPFDLLLALEQRLRRARLEVTTGDATSWTGLGFRLRERWFVVPRDDVREVSVTPKLTRIPGAKPWLLGVANVRGSLLPVSDLAQMLGMPSQAEHRNQRVLVLNAEGLPAGFLVDEVAGYRQFGPGDQRHELAATAPGLEPWLLGAFQREGRDWLVLSLRKLARSETFSHAGA